MGIYQNFIQDDIELKTSHVKADIAIS